MALVNEHLVPGSCFSETKQLERQLENQQRADAVRYERGLEQALFLTGRLGCEWSAAKRAAGVENPPELAQPEFSESDMKRAMQYQREEIAAGRACEWDTACEKVRPGSSR